MVKPTLYVLAGPNGIGKTTSTYNLIPQNIPVINSDEIAKLATQAGLVQGNAQEYSNREAQKYVNDYLTENISFCIETNLWDQETWKFLIALKNKYQIEIYFLCTDNIDLLNKRIDERVQRGEHFVRPDVVQKRYTNAISLLNFYFDVADRLSLIDNSDKPKIVLEAQSGKIQFKSPALPDWAAAILPAQQLNKAAIQDARSLTSKEDVRRLYKESLNNNKPGP